MNNISEIFVNMKKNNIAVIYNDTSITYNDLFVKSQKYYNYIANYGNGKNIVCIICKRSIELIACMLGSIRTGGAYMLFEPEDINNNLISIINSIPEKIVFVEKEIEQIDGAIVMHTVLDSVRLSDEYVIREQADLLYLASTSGSSKDERIIMVEDGNLLCYINSYIEQFDIKETDVILQQSPIYYDGFAEEVFSMLFVGGTIVLTDTINLKNPRKIIEVVNKNSVTILPSTPLMLNEINKLEVMPSVRAIISSGDILKKKYISNLLKWTNVYNMYGLTETTVCATCYKCSTDDEEVIPIGKEITGYQVILKDVYGNEISNSEIGEISILGRGVTRGYWNIQENKITEFEERGRRIFRTGDFAWRDRDGNLHYEGRKDRQVKIRGNKVSLDQIEETICELEDITSVAVTTCETDQNICAFFTSPNCVVNDVKSFCKSRLPYYMRPTQYMKIDKIPISKTGKANYKKLKELYREEKKIEIPNRENLSDIEEKIVKCIIRVLEPQMKQISIVLSNSWEEIGMDSMAYVQLTVEVEMCLGIELNDEILLQGDFATVKEFCDYIGEYINNE